MSLPGVIGGVDFLRAAGELLYQRQLHLEREVHRFEWRQVARSKQLAPGTPGAASKRLDWRYWFIMAGRGFGKTRTGSEWIREQVRLGRRRRIAFVAPTYDSGRKIMIEGPAGILNVSPPDERPRWLHQRKELHWPNGAVGFLYTAEEPDALRGPEHDAAWCEEIGAWRNAEETWNMLRFGMRVRGPLGDSPQTCITSTPRPTKLVRKIVVNPKTEVTDGTTYENRANLDDDFLDAVLTEYEGTRLGEQELLGKLLGDTPGALWRMARIDELRVTQAPDAVRVVVAIDPAVADADERREAERAQRFTAETGIVVAARARCSCRGKEEQHGFVLDDVSGYLEPEGWATRAVEAYDTHSADRIIAEVNNGGALVEATLRALGGDRAKRVSYRAVHASKGKIARAEPIAALYEKGLVHHVGVFAKLEDQMTTYNPLLVKRSPDRLDAGVWALTDLMLGPRAPSFGGTAAGAFSVKRRL